MQEFTEYFTNGFKEAANGFVKDVDALSHDDLARNWGKGSRAAYDFAYEVALINKRAATRLRGEEPGPMPWKFGEEWLKAPAEYCDKEKVKAFIGESVAEVLSAFEGDPMRQVKVADEMHAAYQLMVFVTQHISYHDAQLNFIQAMTGDMVAYW